MPLFWTEKPKEKKNFSPRRAQSSSEPARFCGLSVGPGIFCKGLWQIQDVLQSGRTSIELQQEIVSHSRTLVSLHPLRFGNSELSEPECTSRGQPKFLYVPTHHSWIPMTPVTSSNNVYSTLLHYAKNHKPSTMGQGGHGLRPLPSNLQGLTDFFMVFLYFLWGYNLISS